MTESQDTKKPSQGTQFRRFVYTCNNYKDEDLATLDAFPSSYHLAGFEIAPTTGTPHVQGYIELQKRLRFQQILKLLPPGTHIEYARGTAEECIKYIKDNPQKSPFQKFIEIGKPRGNIGKVYEIKELLEQGVTFRDLVDDPSYGADSASLNIYQKIAPLYKKKRDWKPEVIWVYGPPGAGKTYWVHEQEGENLYSFQLEKRWFDGYEEHEAILWDDFDYDIYKGICDNARDALEQQRLFQRLLALCDRYEYKGNVKGTWTQIVAKRIYIVAHQPPWGLWKPSGYTETGRNTGGGTFDDPPHYESITAHSTLCQLMRRITRIIYYKPSKKDDLKFPDLEIITAQTTTQKTVPPKIEQPKPYIITKS